ncbi:hypothetical protein [Agrobacterium tumefaciens]|uniref:hypothetical protein n=1 Tax=Agrobacterium tumefaciens TaxID=358 RepID=UPI0021CE3916|nr:hypothetical protein [Agrobacterium tumefaciens]UXS03794.1 hypothetical protein FY156_19840 [Agrobacterium tumefaciens]UXS03926.1 hypothetical protein FY156_20625 [Agrobacterium tumefaciens]
MADLLVCFPDLRVWGFGFVTADVVCFLTIEDEKKEKRGRRRLAGPEEISVLRKRLWRSRLEENTPHYERSDARNDGCEFSSIQNVT